MQAARERRRYGRSPISRAMILSQSGVGLSSGRTVNLSPGGACGVMRKPLEVNVNDDVIVTLAIPERTVSGPSYKQVVAAARVCRIENAGGELVVGLQFKQDIDIA